ncbi:unnamed protein product [Phyllotreta striolata]|uniref:G-protein coupled receptors family 1 profile domain-containing protein n=1 Tax=Phyllotreta striolata TaxID=444603 RepID=A0A9N9TQK2_PHYSR|nr:unnamed protein product [Phyllotreta striolata]
MQSAHQARHQSPQNISANITFTFEFYTNETADWGPRRDPLYIVIPISVVYVIIFLSGILGNVSTCVVIARNKCMHTATNYYLFSLAVSDLLLLVSGLPPEIYSIWSKYPYVFGEAFCILQGLTAETSANATVLTITAFTVERYVAICHPFLSHTLSKLNRAVKYIILIWAIAVGLAVPQAMAFGIVCEVLANGYIVEDHCMCMIKREIVPHTFLISTLLFFVAPMSLITVLYICIGLQLRRSTVASARGSVRSKQQKVYNPVVTYVHPSAQVLVLNRRQEARQQDEEGRKNFSKNSQATKHVVKMLVAVVVAFFICWAPFHAQRLLAIYGGSVEAEKSSYMIMAFRILTYISGIFYYISTTVNPLLYHIMSNKFREAFKKTYKQICRKSHQLPAGRCYSTLSGHQQSYSDSYSGGGWAGGGSLRYFDDSVAMRLHDHRRPLVVSFRKHKRTPSRRQEAAPPAGSPLRLRENGAASPASSPGLPRLNECDFKSCAGKMRPSFTFSSPLGAERVVIEKSRSFVKHRSTSEFQDILNCLDNEDDRYIDSHYWSESGKHNGRKSESGRDSETNCSYIEVHTLRPKHICPLSNNVQ